jgi:acyl-CoA thioesterase FadM
MGRVKLKFPDEKPLCTVQIPVRVGDINYGGHLGNDALLSIIHEARVQFLAHWGYTELNAGGNSFIMADVMIAYKGEAFYGDVLTIHIYAEELSLRSFDLLYHISTIRDNETIDIAHAKTGMVCYDYTLHKTVAMTDELRSKLENQS